MKKEYMYLLVGLLAGVYLVPKLPFHFPGA
jgi:hypothetical protein